MLDGATCHVDLTYLGINMEGKNLVSRVEWYECHMLCEVVGGGRATCLRDKVLRSMRVDVPRSQWIGVNSWID
jgi:hypothetical protein